MQEEILEIINAEMIKQNISRAQMARELKTSWAFISSVLSGQGNNPTMNTLFRMCSVLDIRIKCTLEPGNNDTPKEGSAE